MSSIIYYNQETGEVLNEEIRRRFEHKDNITTGYSHVSIISSDRVEIVDGKVTKIYTPEEAERRKQAKFERETDEILDILNLRPKQDSVSSQEFPPPYIETPETLSVPTQQVSTRKTTTKKSVPLTTREKVVQYICKDLLKIKSKTKTKQSSVRNKNKSVEIPKRVVVAVVGAIAIIVIWLIISGTILVQNFGYQLDHTSVRNSTAVLLDKTPNNYSQNIVDKNTRYHPQTEVYWYENDAIGKDVLSLPDKTFDANLYLVYALMGSNADNAYNNNFDDVISYISENATEEKHPMAYLRCHGCSSLSDFLIKNGFVDDKGTPSIESFKKHGRTMTSIYEDFLKELAEAYKEAYLADMEVKGLK